MKKERFKNPPTLLTRSLLRTGREPRRDNPFPQKNSLPRRVQIIFPDFRQKIFEIRLKKEPKGFAMAGKGRSCSLCCRSVHETDGWYDKWGFKCSNCQAAIDKKIIPGSLCGDWDHKKYMTDSTLSWKTGLHIQTIRKLIRKDKIRARQIPNGCHRTNCHRGRSHVGPSHLNCYKLYLCLVNESSYW